jgi:NADH:ubiquinone oxidoreductase subunit E
MVIHLVQDELGAISDDACSWIAEKLEVEPINIKELITFYPMLRETPWGKTMFEFVALYPVPFADLMVHVKFWKKNWV